MRIVHFSCHVKGGAGLAAMRLHKTMLFNNVNSVFYNKYYTDSKVNCFKVEPITPIDNSISIAKFISNKYNGFLNRIYNFYRFYVHSSMCAPYRLDTLLLKDDIVIIHWVSGFLDFKSFFKGLRKEQKVYFYIHDFYIISGRLHTLYDKERIKNNVINLFENQIYKTKIGYIKSLKNYKIIANSKFTYNVIKETRSFPLEKLETIYLGLPKSELTPINKINAKQELGYNKNDFLILISANDVDVPLKGIDRFLNILEYFQGHEKVKFITLGKVKMEFLKSRIHNFVTWDVFEKSKIFSSADVLLSTSYEETFGQTIIEAFACETPTIVYNGHSALSEIVAHNKTGFIANNTREVCYYIEQLIELPDLKEKLGSVAKETYLNKFTSENQFQLFMKIIENK
ncbi:hypothetical protein PK35_05930 [Tamlana nanhaiensis]|uniref:Glycosyl transferase family 1 domain-containing protein n=1 Tax=Neotamlana nanhaiensis TaxID=1382798 RepID=A0A0D7W2Z1_9FLAO|nr:glycosyltransferase [Tamlana nanhaiensis]KJD33394.1 hypothetical protein PK35_05930 [Tamlana nanhaiensis]